MAIDFKFLLDDDGGGRTYLQWLLDAWGWTLAVAASAWVVAMVMGALIGTLRTLPDSPWLTRLANAWVELFRNVPLLVQIFLWYFVVPKMFPIMKELPGFVLVVFALASLPLHVLLSRCVQAYRRCRVASAMLPWL